MQCANQDLNRLRQPNLLPFSASWRCYLGNLGQRMTMRISPGPCLELIVLGLLVVMLTTSALAQDDLHARFMNVCDADFEKNAPGYGPDQRAANCECRLRFHKANSTSDDIDRMVTSLEQGSVMGIEDHMRKADLKYLNICIENPSARP